MLQIKAKLILYISEPYSIRHPVMSFKAPYQNFYFSFEFSNVRPGALTMGHYTLYFHYCFSGDAKYVRLGDRNIASNDDDQYVQEYNVTEKKSYMLYKPPVSYHDIGLIKLDRPVNFTKRVRPACLFTALQLPSTFQVAGWGEVGPKGKRSNVLLSTVLSHFGTDDCNNKVAFNINRQYPKGILGDIQVCAGDEITTSDTCKVSNH